MKHIVDMAWTDKVAFEGDMDGHKVIVEADVTDEHPKHYTKMKVIYQFKGKDLPMDKLEKAVKLSETTYCGVTAAYKKAMEMESEIRIVG